MLSLLRRGSLALALAGCTAHETDEAVAPPSRPTPRDFGIELPPGIGLDDANEGPEVWLGVDTLMVLADSTGLLQLGAPTVDANGMVVGLYEVLDALPRAGALQFSVDRRVSSATFASVLHTAARARWSVSLRAHPYYYQAIDGWPEELTRSRGSTYYHHPDFDVLSIEPAPATSSHPPANRPFDPLAADLLLEWGEHGVLATAQPRPLDRAPFAIDWYDDGTFQLPQRVPLRHADGPGPQDVLDPRDVAAVARALCEMNHGPTGVSLRPLPTTPYAEVLAMAAAAQSAERCKGPRRFQLRTEPARAAASGVAVAAFREHVHAQDR